MAQKNRANMLTDIVSNIYNNLINFITGQNAQDRFVNLLDSSPNILSDASQPNGYVSTDANNEMFSTYYNENDSRANIITKQGLGELVGNKLYQINDADGNTRTLQVCAENALLLHNFAFDVQTGEIGTYDITTDVFLTVSGIPDLQQVTDVGFNTTNKILSDDAAGNYTEVGNGYVQIATGNIGDVNIDASLVTASYTAQLPDKPTSPQTFAMMSDIGGLDLEVNGTPNVDQTLLNLVAGTNITLTDDGIGSVTIDASGGGGGDVYLANDQTFTGQNTFTISSGSDTPITINKGGSGAGLTVNKTSGSGDAIEVANGSVSIADETASTIAHFDGSKRLKSLNTSTYPSLTELSYVKGVTSAIQTQLNALKAPISSVGNGTAVTGVIVNTYSKGLLIPANSRTANDVVQVDFQVTKTGAAGNVQLRFYWNTTNDITTGSPILLGTSPNGAALWLAFSRLLSIEVANGTGNATKVAPTTVTTLATGYGTNTTTTSTVAIDWTANGYLICSILNSNAADSSVCNMLKLN